MAEKRKREGKLKLGKDKISSVSGGVDRGEVLGWLNQHNPIGQDYEGFLDLAYQFLGLTCRLVQTSGVRHMMIGLLDGQG